MAESSVIREFLVRIGFKVDADSQKKFKDGVEDATKQTEALDKAQVNAGKSAVKMAAAIVDVGGWLASRTTDFAAKLENLHFAARRTGAAASSLKAVANAAQDVGVTADQAQSSIEGVARFMRNNPGGESYIASLGVQTRDANGHLRDTVDIVNDLGKTMAKQQPWLARQYAATLGIDENYMLGMRDPAYAASYDRAKHDYANSGVDKSNNTAHDLMSRLRALQSKFEATVGTVGAWGIETGATLGGGLLSYFGAKSVVQGAIGKALGKGAQDAAAKAAATAAEGAAKAAAESAAATAAEAGAAAATAAGGATSTATGRAIGLLARALPWAGRLFGGLGLLFHSEDLNSGESEDLRKRQRLGPTIDRPKANAAPQLAPTPAAAPVRHPAAEAPVAAGQPAAANAPAAASLGERLANSALGRLISRGEGDYNSVNRGARGGYKSGTEDLASMTLAQVMAGQRSGRFNAVGRYQVVRDTLAEAARALHLSGNEKFDQPLQDRIFGEYLVSKKRSAIGDFLSGKSANLHAALLAASREWASVANPDTGRSYYDGVGNNHASITAKELENALRNSQSLYRQNPDLVAGMQSRGPVHIEVKPDVKIQVIGSADPDATARSVAREQRNVNDGIVRNLQGVVG